VVDEPNVVTASAALYALGNSTSSDELAVDRRTDDGRGFATSAHGVDASFKLDVARLGELEPSTPSTNECTPSPLFAVSTECNIASQPRPPGP
jgi:hypothetical protein